VTSAERHDPIGDLGDKTTNSDSARSLRPGSRVFLVVVRPWPDDPNATRASVSS
jgi:hypothetical protein